MFWEQNNNKDDDDDEYVVEKEKGWWKLGGDEYVYGLIVVTVSQVYTYHQNNLIVYIKYVRIFTCQSYSVKWFILKSSSFN